MEAYVVKVWDMICRSIRYGLAGEFTYKTVVYVKVWLIWKAEGLYEVSTEDNYKAREYYVKISEGVFNNRKIPSNLLCNCKILHKESDLMTNIKHYHYKKEIKEGLLIPGFEIITINDKSIY